MTSRLLTTKCAPVLRGIDLLRDPFKNMGLDFGEAQRCEYNLKGLLPVMVDSESAFQEKVCMARLKKIDSDFDKYDSLMRIYDTNRDLFFRLLNHHVTELMPLVYTPTVGAACQEYPLVHNHGRGLYVPITERGNIRDCLRNWPYAEKIKAIAVTDGERIQGLGDLGSYGMGIPIGILALYTGLGGIPSDSLLPITIDVGTNNENLLASPLYFGLRQKRVTGKAYDEFVDEFLQACAEVFGKEIFIHFEDFGNQNAFRFLKQYRGQYCTYNGDIQGTASVILSGMISASRLTGRPLNEEHIVCYGAGESTLGFGELFVEFLKTRFNMPEEDARSHIWMVDRSGLIVEKRSAGEISAEKAPYARQAGSSEMKNLKEIIAMSKATTLIGASAVPGAFDAEVLATMAKQCPRPLIFALSNPTQKSECTALAAYKATKGACIFASGSPFDPVTLNAKEALANTSLSRKPGQANNAYIFPGLALAIIAAKIRPVTNNDLIHAAEALSENVDYIDLCQGCLYPSLEKIRGVSYAIARRVANQALREGRVWLDGRKDGKSDLTEEDIKAAVFKMASCPAPPIIEASEEC